MAGQRPRYTKYGFIGENKGVPPMGQADTFNSPQLKKLHEQATKDKDLQKIVAKLEKRLASLLS